MFFQFGKGNTTSSWPIKESNELMLHRSMAYRADSAVSASVCARYPQHIARALGINVPRQDEQMIGQAICVHERLRIDRLALDQRGDVAFGAPDDRSRNVQGGGGRSAAGQHERTQRRQGGIHHVDLALQPVDLRLYDAQCLARRFIGHNRCAQVRPKVEQIVLDARQHGVDVRVVGALQPGDPDGGRDLPTDVADSSVDVAGAYLESEVTAWALRGLSAREREIAVKRCIEGKTAEQTAAETGCTANAVDQTFFRAKKKMRANLDEYLGDDDFGVPAI